jgi:hypothetical protein
MSLPYKAAQPPARSDQPARQNANDTLVRGGGLALALPPQLVDALAERAAEIVAEETAGFLGVKAAAAFLGGWSPKRIYNLVERGAIPYYKPHGRLLFDPRELREWVTEGGHGRR